MALGQPLSEARAVHAAARVLPSIEVHSPMTVRRTCFVFSVVLVAVAGCGPSAAPGSTADPSVVADAAPFPTGSGIGSVVLVGRIVTMDEPPVAEALLIEDGTVTAVGTRDDVLALAGDQVPIVDIGQNVAYPGFIDAHAHWIGDREYYGLETAADAMQAALARGWTSISEQWVNQERLTELETLAADDALPLRVDAYLTLNEPQIGGRHFGDWYADRQPGPITDHLRVRGLKIHLDTGFELDLLWEPDDLTATVARANEAGWQVAIHVFSDEAQELVLDAFEAAIGPTGPNPLHHRIEHAVQVTDEQLARMVAMGIAVVIHLDTAVADWLGRAGDPVGDGRRDRLAGPLAGLRGGRAACGRGDRHALDPPGLQADR